MGNQEDIRKQLREKFEYFEPEPTRDIWAGIEQAVRPKPFYKRVGWYVYASAAVVLLLVAIGVSLTEVSYRQPVVPARAVAAVKPDTIREPQLSPAQDEKRSGTQEQLADFAEPEKKKEPTQTPFEVAQQREGELIASKPDERDANQAEAATPVAAEKEPVELLAIKHPKSELPAIGQDLQPEVLSSIETIPVGEIQNPKTTGNRNRIDLADISLEDAVTMAGNGLKKLTKKPATVSENEDGTETTKTYRINFLDISFSRRTHTFKSTKDET